MENKTKDSDMCADVYLSSYDTSKEAKPQRVKTYVFFKKLGESTKNFDNLVTAASDTNEVSVSFNERTDCRVFTFDKVSCTDVSQIELYESVVKSAIQDAMSGFNCFIVMYQLSNPNLKYLEGKIPFLEMDLFSSIVSYVLKDLLSNIKNEEAMDSTLHASYFEIHGNKIVDFLSNCTEHKDIKIFENIDQNCIEAKDLSEKPLVNENDISELLLKKSSCNNLCYSVCCHSVLSATVVKKNINCDGFEFIKVGKLTVVNSAKCISNILLEKVNETCSEDVEYAVSGLCESPYSCKSKLNDMLKSAFGSNAKTSIILTVSSVLHSPEKDLCTMQFVSEARKILNYPDISQKIIKPSSLKEYSDEIRELQKDLNAVSKDNGILLDNLMYRSLKHSLTVESEKVKALNNYQLSLSETSNAKRQKLISLHTTLQVIESEIKEGEKFSEDLRCNSEKIKNENMNIKQKVFTKTEDIFAIKNMENACDISTKKLKSELRKAGISCSESVLSFQSLNSGLISLSNDVKVEREQLKNSLNLLVTNMSDISSKFHTLQNDLFMKLNNLSYIDVLLKTWRHNIENLLSKVSCFTDDYNRNFNTIKLEISSSVVPVYESQSEMADIIQNNRNEEWQKLIYYFHKIQIFLDASLKILHEIIHQLDVIQTCSKTELKVLGAKLSCSSKAFKKFMNDMNIFLKLSQQCFEEQEKELLWITDIVYHHHNFKKHFDENIGSIKNSLLTLKQTCSSHNDAILNKWNEVQKDSAKTSQKYTDLSEHLFLVQKEMSKYLDNLSQQNMNVLELSALKDKTENAESRTTQLPEMHKEAKTVVEVVSEINRKRADKEFLEVKKFTSGQKAATEKQFDIFSSNMETISRSFYNELRCIQHILSDNRENLKENLDLLLSSVSHLAIIYNDYTSVSNSIGEKIEDTMKILPEISKNGCDMFVPSSEMITLDEEKFVTSTPNNTERILNLSSEKEKLIGRLKSVAEQMMTQDSHDQDSDFERKDKSLSTMSLPNLHSHSKMDDNIKKNLTKLSKK